MYVELDLDAYSIQWHHNSLSMSHLGSHAVSTCDPFHPVVRFDILPHSCMDV